jgi:hypothetical protein
MEKDLMALDVWAASTRRGFMRSSLDGDECRDMVYTQLQCRSEFVACRVEKAKGSMSKSFQGCQGMAPGTP